MRRELGKHLLPVFMNIFLFGFICSTTVIYIKDLAGECVISGIILAVLIWNTSPIIIQSHIYVLEFELLLSVIVAERLGEKRWQRPWSVEEGTRQMGI